MICWVVESALSAPNVSRAIVATDDERIRQAVDAAGYEARMTSSRHRSGTDRIAEVAESLPDTEIIVNVQGDEPFISSETIARAVEALSQETEVSSQKSGGGDQAFEKQVEIGMVTTWEAIESAQDVLNPDVVKIVVDNNENAVYFSRSPVPYPRDAVRQHGSLEQALKNDPTLLARFRKHTGLYVFRREVLLQFASWEQTELEKTEALEQLRALEHGVKIRAIEASTPSIGVDTIEDLRRARVMAEKEARGRTSAMTQANRNANC